MNTYSPMRMRNGIERIGLIAFIIFFASLFSFEEQNCSAQETAKPSSATKAKSVQNDSTPETVANITFGHRQLEQMLNDRPDMRDSIPISHPVRNAIIEGFNGDRVGYRIYWVDTKTKIAFNQKPYRGFPAYLSIPKGTKHSPIDKWVFALFEIYNSEGDSTTNFRDACKGIISKEEYVKRCVELEAEAGKKTKDFFAEHPLPTSPKDKTYNFYFSKEAIADPNKQLGITTDNSTYFSKAYDSRVAPYLERVNANKSKRKADKNGGEKTIEEQQFEKLLEKFDLPNADK